MPFQASKQCFAQVPPPQLSSLFDPDPQASSLPHKSGAEVPPCSRHVTSSASRDLHPPVRLLASGVWIPIHWRRLIESLIADGQHRSLPGPELDGDETRPQP